MKQVFKRLPLGSTSLHESIFQIRSDLNRKYMMSLKNEDLLQNYYLEAGLSGKAGMTKDCHWGWEAPTCQIRGHFLGHWLSAAAHYIATNKEIEMKAKADFIVSELGRCQKENGGEWVGSIPEKYFDWLANGKDVWAPHYTIHKTFMGLIDMFTVGGNKQTIDILVKWADWFYRWTGKLNRQQWKNILDKETGGMLEVWADIYKITQRQEHYELMQRYERRNFFSRLIAGEDVLTNKHVNTTIPEILGAARAYEVTGEEHWCKIVEAYWKLAVTDRGYFCTGGQSFKECWTPPQKLSTRLGNENQEHCTVYNMMRLAEYLYRWTGDVTYADYWERNLYNGVLAQQNPETGQVAYFLPLGAGLIKKWGTPTEDFWCCHGTLVQAHYVYSKALIYEDENDLVLTQYIPSQTH